MSRGVALRLASLLSVMLALGSCSSWPDADPVFVGAAIELIDCPESVAEEFECVRVFSDVDGTTPGTGSCVLYATGTATPIAVAASGELDLVPGRVVEWEVVAPVGLGSDQWNPVCRPTAEG